MQKTIIIAEAGVNHNGDIRLAFELIDKAVEAGVDYIKFQSFKANKIISQFAPKAEYQVNNTGINESQLEMVKKLELSENDHHILKEYCDKKGIAFLSTPFDDESIVLLKRLGVKIGKVPSGEIVNLPYLRNMARNFESLIISTGMSDMEEIEHAIAIVLQEGMPRENITILHCNTEYPTPVEDVNLNAMLNIGKKYNVKIGYSDHTKGIEVPIAAVALGATIIEKHFTLDKNMPGPDHKASLEPAELAQMTSAIRNIEQALGDGRKTPTPSEIKNRPVVRKSIVAAKPIKRGEIFTAENLTLKRPGNGISPMKWDDILGRKAVKDFNEDEMISL